MQNSTNHFTAEEEVVSAFPNQENGGVGIMLIYRKIPIVEVPERSAKIFVGRGWKEKPSSSQIIGQTTLQEKIKSS
jgi:hypothetical protein